MWRIRRRRITAFCGYPMRRSCRRKCGREQAALEAFPESEASLVTTRDFALAWETLAQRGVEGASREAEEYLAQGGEGAAG